MKILTTIICGTLLVLLGIVSCDDNGAGDNIAALATSVAAEVAKILGHGGVVLTYPATDTNGAAAVADLVTFLKTNSVAIAAIAEIKDLRDDYTEVAVNSAIRTAIIAYTDANPITPPTGHNALTIDQINTVILEEIRIP